MRGGERCGHAGFGKREAALGDRLPSPAGSSSARRAARLRTPGANRAISGPMSRRVRAQQPGRGALDHVARSRAASRSALRRHLVVERLDLGPQRPQLEDLAHDHDRRARSRPRARPVRACMSWTKVMPARLTRSLVTTVAMISRRSGWVAICARKPLAQRRREIAAQIGGQLRHRRAGRRRAARRRASSWRRRAAPRARAGSAPALRRARRERLVVGQEFERAVEPARAFELADQPRLPVERARRRAPRRPTAPRPAGNCRAAPGRRPRRSSARAAGRAPRPRARRRRSPGRAGS